MTVSIDLKNEGDPMKVAETMCIMGDTIKKPAPGSFGELPYQGRLDRHSRHPYSLAA
jgi:hypothetical protein